MIDFRTMWNDQLKPVVLSQMDPDVKALVAHGSVVENLGGSGSDFDILGITEAVKGCKVLDVGELRVHLEYMPLVDLKSLAESIDDQLQKRMFDLNLLTGRLKDAVVLHDPEGIAEACLRPFREYKPSKLTLQKFWYQGLGFLEDFRGALQRGDVETAVVCARLALISLSCRWLLAHGVTNLNIKWQAQFLARIKDPDAQRITELYRRIGGLNSCVADTDQLERDLREFCHIVIQRT